MTKMARVASAGPVTSASISPISQHLSLQKAQTDQHTSLQSTNGLILALCFISLGNNRWNTAPLLAKPQPKQPQSDKLTSNKLY